ncbi:maleylpyruvate isomerase family mycothiol-dependent enzyme [Rhodococcus sp. NPDC003318]|uniref:maleylpyruvate isomerase family mycothiol-dependent enzyme n=1 Tax=Rhodococcus sp. NPDC003318 TaxID=3364503 RepID=UPI0036739F24
MVRRGSEVREHVMAERAELVALLRTLSPEDWQTPSLCAGWRVRDVVAHIALDTVPPVTYLRTVARHPSPDRANAQFVDSFRDVAPDELVDRIEESAATSWFTRFAPRIALADHLVHHQDIRRPLGRPRPIAPDRLRHVLSHPDPFAFPRRYTKGLRFVATDVDWASGSGPDVRGPGEALALAVVGRPVVLDELTGDGVATLRARMIR